MQTDPYEIATFYRNGELKERYALHVEACPDEEWRAACESLGFCEMATMFQFGQETRHLART